MDFPVNQTVLRRVDGALRGALHRVFAHRCLACEARAHGRDLCDACADALPFNRIACPRCAVPMPLATDACGTCLRHPPPLDAVHAVFVYRPPVDALLPRVKFRGDLAAARVLSDLMAGALCITDRPQALVAMPLHRTRLRQRGFDQALELARPLARTLGLPLRTDLLERTRDTSPQTRLDAVQRRRNVRNAFSVRTARPLPAHVALVDDVMTTGATLHAAAIALRRAGVSRVDAWVCARVP